MSKTADIELDQAFWNEERRRTPVPVRVACVLGIGAFASYYFLDPLVTSNVEALSRARLVVIAFHIAIIVFSLSEFAKAHFRVLALLPCFAIGFGAVTVTQLAGGGESRYHEALLLAFFAYPLVVPARPISAGLSFAIVTLTYDIVMIATDTTGSLEVWANNNFILWVGVVIGTAGVALMYRQRRNEFDARTNLAKTTEDLAEALDRAREVDKLKSDFFANISHELRTPLTLILSPVEELLASLSPGAERDALTVVRRNAQRLLRLIDDLLDLAKLEAGGLRLRVRETDVGSLAKQVAENAKPACDAKGIDLRFETIGQAPVMYGDPHRLEIIFTNLIGNAIKFTPDGGKILVGVDYSPDGATVRVADTGPGIPEDQIDRIFERFHQIRGSERRGRGGVGIGLALAKELTEVHGGRLTVESVWGEGSTFKAFLCGGKAHFQEELIERREMQISEHPGRRAEDRLTSAPAADNLPGPETRKSRHPRERILLDRGRTPRILLVEDEADLRAFMYGILAQYFEVSAAVDGAEALEILEKHRPDLVLSDITMPKVSGFDLCRAIKRDPRLQHIPVILLTARGESETAIQGYEAGADDFVAKPFHTRVLLARIGAHLKMRALSLQIADQARLASAGTLAAGLAHEVKNPINAILSAATVLEAGGSSKVPSEKLLGIIIDGVRRVNDVVSALNAHARPADGTDLQAVDVREGVESTLRLLEHKMKDIQVHREIETTQSVRAPARAFNQIVLNLVDNAIRSGGHTLWVTLSQQDDMVQIAVADDGPGVPADLVSRIFDPFFTTRPEGEGTGLGLHLSRKMAQECGGELRYETRPEGGARFVLNVPVMAGGDVANDAAQ